MNLQCFVLNNYLEYLEVKMMFHSMRNVMIIPWDKCLLYTRRNGQ